MGAARRARARGVEDGLGQSAAFKAVESQVESCWQVDCSNDQRGAWGSCGGTRECVDL